MVLAKNLQHLRKRDKITQEELADKIGVSRQSVSKWETGEAYPETDKLILLCELFNVSLDGLLRSDLSAGGAESVSGETEKAEEPAPYMDGKDYTVQMNRFARGIAFGVFLVLLGVAVCVALSGVSVTLKNQLKNLTEVLGGVAVLVFVAAAVFLFAFSGIRYDRFRKEHPVMGEVFSEHEVRAFGKRFAIAMPSLISGILLDVVFLIVFTSLIDAGVITVFYTAAANSYIVAAFLGILACLVSGIVYFGIQHGKYHVAEYNKQSGTGQTRSRGRKIKDAICGSIMMAATALFLVLGFAGGWWHPGWVVFPVGGILCGIVGAIFDAKYDRD